MTHAYTFGMEEEYFLVDLNTKTATAAMPEAFFQAAKAELGSQVMGEMLQSQIEVATVPHTEMVRAAAELKYLRQTVAAIAAKHGLAILASGTHPTAEWGMSQQTQKERYDTVMHDLGMVGRRNMLCGLHVHVELPDPDDRIDVMYRMLPYLPLFVALSTSSPFWQSHRTGLKGYRLAAYNELPRTGVPELFRTREEFDAYVQALVRSGVIEDSSYIWWAIRPSLGHPTLELRAPDSCTLVDDSIAIAALYRCLARRLTGSPWLNADMTPVMRALVVENKWRAQRYGVNGTFVNETGTGAVTVAEMLNQVVDDVTPDAEELNCLAEVRRCRAIVGAGTSADAQLAIFDAHIFDAQNDSTRHVGALNAVTDWIAAATLQQS
jgi:glutamate---cysteine ligase / carboxylate-amine ligase